LAGAWFCNTRAAFGRLSRLRQCGKPAGTVVAYATMMSVACVGFATHLSLARIWARFLQLFLCW
jgi:hypothetical protein